LGAGGGAKFRYSYYFNYWLLQEIILCADT